MTYVVGVFIVVVGVCVGLLMQRVLEVSNELVALRKEVELLKQVTREKERQSSFDLGQYLFGDKKTEDVKL